MRAVIYAALVACTPNVPFGKTTVSAPPDAFARATNALVDAGESIETKDESAGLILTKWEDTNRMGTDYRYRWRIEIVNGNATVDSQCQFRIKTSVGDGKWDACDVQPGDRTEKGRAIADKIKR